MALTPRLEIRQSQNLTLTPQLLQSIKLLQLSHIELNNFVEEELLTNPLLEREEAEGSVDQVPASEQGSREETPQDFPELVESGAQLASATTIAQELDTDKENLFPEQVGQDSIAASTAQNVDFSSVPGGGESPDIDQYIAKKLTLSDHLVEQVSLIVSEHGDRLIARNLIDNLNADGYLAADIASIAQQLGTDHEQVESVLKRIQRAEPVGVFARDLHECLALQLREKNRLDPMMSALLENLDLVASHDFKKLMGTIGASPEDLKDMLAEIRALDPRPGRAFDQADVQVLIPDIFVSESPDGGWQIELNSEILPRVLVNRVYYASVTKRARKTKEKTFLIDCLHNANWLIKSLDQRAQTILKVATEIVRRQDEFLIHGVTRLTPLTLKNVADEIDMHESTVSRVTSNKYMTTPRGVFELKYFFTTAIASSDGLEEYSAESVRHLIKQMIEVETLNSILSDDIIAETLNTDHGIHVARRTVAKYRENLHIPSSVVRRRQKKAQILPS